MNTNKKIKLIGTIFGIVLFIIMIAGITYAWITWSSGNVKLSGKSGCFPDINYTNGTSLSTDNILLFDEDLIIKDNTILLKDGMAYLGMTIGVNDECTTPVELSIKLDYDIAFDFWAGSSVGAFKYALVSYDPSLVTDLSELKGQYLDIVETEEGSNPSSILDEGPNFLNDIPIDTEVKGYLLIFYIDGDLAFNEVQNSSFSVNITGKVEQVEEHIEE